MNEVIAEIFRDRQVKGKDGSTFEITTGVSQQTGEILSNLIKENESTKTLEIGMAYGLSTLFMCQTHRDVGHGNHLAIDPFQTEHFGAVGLHNIERAGLDDLLEFHEAKSSSVLPQLIADGRQFDLAFVDGSHMFDHALIDCFFVDELLAIGGILVIDDLWMRSVRKAASFMIRNRGYQIVPPPAHRPTPLSKRLLRASRRLLQNPFGRDWRLKLVPENILIVQKVKLDDRPWDFHRAF